MAYRDEYEKLLEQNKQLRKLLTVTCDTIKIFQSTTDTSYGNTIITKCQEYIDTD